MRKYWKYLIIVVQVIVVVSLIKGLLSSIVAKRRVSEMEAKKESLILEKKKLADKQKEVESEYYVEKVAREQLHLVKPGEVVVMTPNLEVVSKENNEEVKTKKNWEKWLEVFIEQ